MRDRFPKDVFFWFSLVQLQFQLTQLAPYLMAGHPSFDWEDEFFHIGQYEGVALVGFSFSSNLQSLSHFRTESDSYCVAFESTPFWCRGWFEGKPKDQPKESFGVQPKREPLLRARHRESHHLGPNSRGKPKCDGIKNHQGETNRDRNCFLGFSHVGTHVHCVCVAGEHLRPPKRWRFSSWFPFKPTKGYQLPKSTPSNSWDTWAKPWQNLQTPGASRSRGTQSGGQLEHFLGH